MGQEGLPKACTTFLPNWRLFHRCESFAGPHVSCHLPKVFVILQAMSVNWESLSACFPGWYLCRRNVPVRDLLTNDFLFSKHLWYIQCVLLKEETIWQTLLLFLVFIYSSLLINHRLSPLSGLSTTAWNIRVFTPRQNPSWVQAAGWHNQIKMLWILKMIPLLVLSPLIKAEQLSPWKQSGVHSTAPPISTLKTCVRNDGKWNVTEWSAGNRVLHFHVSVIFFLPFQF